MISATWGRSRLRFDRRAFRMEEASPLVGRESSIPLCLPPRALSSIPRAVAGIAWPSLISLTSGSPPEQCAESKACCAPLPDTDGPVGYDDDASHRGGPVG